MNSYRTKSKLISSKSLAGSSEICMLMPIRPDFTGGLATRGYESRLRSFSKLFSDLRSVTRESRLNKPYSDIVARMQTIHGVTISLVEGKLLLTVHFDRPWEPYIRMIWQELGDIFDLILCNCEGYLEQHRTGLGYEAFAGWIRKYQVETNTYYLDSTRTVSDVIYLEQLERQVLDGRSSASELSKLSIRTPEDEAELARQNLSDREYVEYIKTGVQAASAFHALTELYPKGSGDHRFLLRAARSVLPENEFPKRKDWRDPTDIAEKTALGTLQTIFRTELEWFENWKVMKQTPSQPPSTTALDLSKVQGGIAVGYQANVGCMALIQIVNAPKARNFLGGFKDQLSWGGEIQGEVYRNLAFTFDGLSRLGLADEALEAFPPVFQEGMAARAGLIGDLRTNHPDHWEHPPRNWGTNSSGKEGPGVNVESVDIVLQLRAEVPPSERHHGLHAKLETELKAIASQLQGAMLILSVVPTYSQGEPGAPIEHFGYRDGISNPTVKANGQADASGDVIAAGDVFLGNTNSRADRAAPNAPWSKKLFRDGTFLVVRKLAEDVAALNSSVEKNINGYATLSKSEQQAEKERLLALLMGRDRAGTPLVPYQGKGINDFDFIQDPDGAKCPMFSHIRRVNPRDGDLNTPRVVRRGMSFGPAYSDSNADEDRGILFQAYCASIPEQFEVLQRWISGGNRTAPYSEMSDPLIGVPQAGQPRVYRLANGDTIDLGDEPFVKLQWGLYLFTPSQDGLHEILSSQQCTADDRIAEQGQRLIDELLALEPHAKDKAFFGWKRLLEEKDSLDDEQDRAVWQVIRDKYKGVLRTPFGVLVGDENNIKHVLTTPKDFSVVGYDERLVGCVGRNYLGMDPPEHDLRADDANQIFYNIDEDAAFAAAYDKGKALLSSLAKISGQATIPLPKYADLLLAEVSKHWFGVPDGTTLLELLQKVPQNPAASVQAGGEPDAGQSTAHCPFHVISSSRFVFQPQPTDEVDEKAKAEGLRLKRAMNNYIAELVKDPNLLKRKPVMEEVYNVLLKSNLEADFSEVVLGALLGFMPTVQGNFYYTTREWIRHRDLWRFRNEYLAALDSQASPSDAAKSAIRPRLVETIAHRPIPAMIHRRATRGLQLSDVEVKTDEMVVVGLVSATAQSGYTDMSAAFGGNYRDSPKPTHACPGQKLGVGTLLGMLAALFEVEGTLRRATSDGALLFDPSR